MNHSPHNSRHTMADHVVEDAARHARSGPPPAVVIWDPVPSRRDLVHQAASTCGARSMDMDALSDVETVEYGPYCCIAIVAAGRCSAEEFGALEVMRRLKNRGFGIISYEHLAHTWPTGKRCQVLFAGASSLLDSHDRDFSRELRQTLSALLRSESEKCAEDERMCRLMASMGIIGNSDAMHSVFRWVLRASTLSDLPTLITGESGTGKELIAYAVHRLDPKRRSGPFVAVNCGAISPTLAEAELFGHRKGAFTGADRDRAGLVRSAHGGVLFLDEIGELHLDLQAKLLRVLQQSRVLSLGEDQEIPVDIRVIAATNRDLEQMVAEKTFRADLFHRLNVLSTHILPLAERPADLQPLVNHFLAKHAVLTEGRVQGADPDFFDALKLTHLSGNVRELENLVRRALVNKVHGTSLGLADLPAEIWRELAIAEGFRERSPSPAASGGTPFRRRASDGTPPASSQLVELLQRNQWNLSHTLRHCERILVEAALERTQGNQSQAARLLGITPRSVYNKVRKHQPDA